jgi:DhnA family fructose-bisphosphate aldolase class Ia
LLVRADWTNALRRDEFVLPLENVEYIPLLEPSHALNLGANALVMHFILGHDEEIEAQCMQRTVNLALEGSNLGMPVIVDVQPIGSRVVLMNKAIELGVSFALEGGADGVAVPWPGSESFEIIETMCGCTPVWVKPLGLEADAPELAEALQLGATGIWLGESIFGDDDPVKSLKKYKSLVHAPLGAHEEGVA